MANEKLEKEIDKIQHELMVSETRYRKLFETSKDGILLIDPRTEKIIDANPALLKLTGHSLKNIVGKKLWEIGVIKDTEITKTLFETLQKKGFVHYEGLPLQTKDNKEHQVEFVSNKYPIDGTKMIQCNIRDITDRKVAEKRASAYLDELKDELNLNHFIMEFTTCGILIYNVKSGKCIFANDAISKQVGGSREQLLKQDFRKIKSWEQGGLKGAAEAAILTGAPQHAEQHIITSFGKEAYLEAVFITFTKGEDQFLMVIVHDVWKTKTMEEALEKKIAELAATNKLMVGRELKMLELKEQIETLKKQLAAK
ncbi:MAG: PAS domain S-box protein [Minisyncoccia bacterium]|jgi:PAS domain S-box-containing protein